MRTYKLAIGILFAFIALAVYGQTNTPPTTEIPDPKSGQYLLLTLIPLAVPFVVALVKHAIKFLPTWTLPIIAPALGALFDYISQVAGGPSVGLLAGAALGSAGVGVREAWDQVKKAIDDRKAETGMIIVAGSLLLQGCATSPELTRSAVSATVSTGVAIGVRKNPQAIPYLKVAAPIVCSAAAGTNLAPAEIAQKINESAQLEALKNDVAVLIFNNALSIYTGFYNQYGSTNIAGTQLQAWLGGVCDGLNLGLATAGTNGNRLPQAR